LRARALEGGFVRSFQGTQLLFELAFEGSNAQSEQLAHQYNGCAVRPEFEHETIDLAPLACLLSGELAEYPCAKVVPFSDKALIFSFRPCSLGN
jgi:hypothetical protein